MAMIDNGTRILRAFFMETGTTPDMTARNFTSAVRPEHINILDQTTNGGSITNAKALAGVAGDVILPDMSSGRAVALPGGLGSKRLRFLLELGNPHPSANSTRIYINGYTDFCGYSLQGQDLAPDMKLFFNSATEVTTSQQYVNGVVVPHTTVIGCDHILHPGTLAGSLGSFAPAMSFNQNGILTAEAPSFIRPFDVMCHNQSLMDNSNSPIPLIDTRAGITSAMSSRFNNVPAMYLEKTLNSLAKGAFEMATTTGYSNDNVYMHAASNAAERQTGQTRLLERLSTDFDYLTNGYITWRSLCEACPELHQPGVAKLFTQKQIHSQRPDTLIPNAGDFDSLANNATIHSQLISQVLHSVPALLLRYLITECSMIVTNQTLDGHVSVTIQAPLTLVDLPAGYMAQKLPLIMSSLEDIIFSNMGINRYAPFVMQLRINCFGDTIVNLRYNSQDFSTAVPSYCDAMHSLIVSPTSSALGTIASDIAYINDCLTNSAGPIVGDGLVQPSYAAPQPQQPQGFTNPSQYF